MSTTITCYDCRRQDLRKNLLANPYWISSAEVGGIMMGTSVVIPIDTYHGGAAVLFSFPHDKRITIVHEVAVQITTAFTVSGGAATLTIGYGTIPLDTSISPGNSGTLTYTSTDTAYVTASDISTGSIAFYVPTTANTSSWLTSRIGTRTKDGAQYMTGVDGTTGPVPCIAAWVIDATGGSVITAGRFRVHMLVSEIPGDAPPT